MTNLKMKKEKFWRSLLLGRKHYRLTCKNKKNDFSSKVEEKTLQEAEKTCYTLLKINRNHVTKENDIFLSKHGNRLLTGYLMNFNYLTETHLTLEI